MECASIFDESAGFGAFLVTTSGCEIMDDISALYATNQSDKTVYIRTSDRDLMGKNQRKIFCRDVTNSFQMVMYITLWTTMGCRKSIS